MASRNAEAQMGNHEWTKGRGDRLRQAAEMMQPASLLPNDLPSVLPVRANSRTRRAGRESQTIMHHLHISFKIQITQRILEQFRLNRLSGSEILDWFSPGIESPIREGNFWLLAQGQQKICPFRHHPYLENLPARPVLYTVQSIHDHMESPWL
jgi:hypothetical protein